MLLEWRFRWRNRRTRSVVCACLVASSCVAAASPALAAEPGTTLALRPPVSPFGNVEEFTPIRARYVRFVILETNGGRPIVDEIEVFTAEPDPRNIALRDAGSRASASSSEVVGTMHQLRNIHDGKYGNDSSWLGGDQPEFNAAQQPVPRGTRQIVVTMTARRRGGDFNDGYADNISLVLHASEGPSNDGLNSNLLTNGGTEADGDVGDDNVAAPKGWVRMDGSLTVWPYAASGLRVRSKINSYFAGGYLACWRGTNEEHARSGL